MLGGFQFVGSIPGVTLAVTFQIFIATMDPIIKKCAKILTLLDNMSSWCFLSSWWPRGATCWRSQSIIVSTIAVMLCFRSFKYCSKPVQGMFSHRSVINWRRTFPWTEQSTLQFLAPLSHIVWRVSLSYFCCIVGLSCSSWSHVNN